MSLKTNCAKCTTVSHAAAISLLRVVVVLGKVALRVECQQTSGVLEDIDELTIRLLGTALSH